MHGGTPSMPTEGTSTHGSLTNGRSEQAGLGGTPAALALDTSGSDIRCVESRFSFRRCTSSGKEASCETVPPAASPVEDARSYTRKESKSRSKLAARSPVSSRRGSNSFRQSINQVGGPLSNNDLGGNPYKRRCPMWRARLRITYT